MNINIEYGIRNNDIQDHAYSYWILSRYNNSPVFRSDKETCPRSAPTPRDTFDTHIYPICSTCKYHATDATYSYTMHLFTYPVHLHWLQEVYKRAVIRFMSAGRA